MVKKIILICFLFISIACTAQEKTRFVNKGLLRSMATFATGYMPQHNTQNLYLIGELEYYTSKNISIRSNVNYFLNGLGDIKYLKINHQVFTGALYHIKTKGNFDPYVGFQPGVSLTQPNNNPCPSCRYFALLPPIEDTKSVNPLVSGLVGANYYASKIFHLSFSARYIYGNDIFTYAPFSLKEFQFQFGLGMNLWVKKPVEN